MINYSIDVLNPDGSVKKSITGMAVSLDKIEDSTLSLELGDPEVREAFLAKYGTREERQQQVASTLQARRGFAARDYRAIETELQAIIASNPSQIQLRFANILLDITQALKQVVLVLREQEREDTE